MTKNIMINGLHIAFPDDMVVVYVGDRLTLSRQDTRPVELITHDKLRLVQRDVSEPVKEAVKEPRFPDVKMDKQQRYNVNKNPGYTPMKILEERGQRVKQLPADTEKRIIRYMRRVGGTAYKRALVFELIGAKNPFGWVLGKRLNAVLGKMVNDRVITILKGAGGGTTKLYGLTAMMDATQRSEPTEEHDVNQYSEGVAEPVN